MIQQGLVLLVQGDTTVSSLCSSGGYYVELPKDATLPSWTYRFISNQSKYTLQGQDTLTDSRVQIDCFGDQAADAILLAHAIDNVLNGYHGILTDPDSTRVQGCFQSDAQDFFDDVRRSYRYMLEYELYYNAT